MTTPAQRSKLHAAMLWTLAHAAQIHYPPNDVRHNNHVAGPISNLAQLQQAVLAPAALTIDCSQGVTVLCHAAGLTDPNGLGYSYDGYTGTLLEHLPHYSNPADAYVGAIVVFGPGTGEHAAMVLTPDPVHGNPLLWSHGDEAGPGKTLLHTEASFHAPPVTMLSIAGL